MATTRVKMPVSQVQVGMFVSDLDRPWVETPFPLQGFYIRHARDIQVLEGYCKHVYIDQALQPHTGGYDVHEAQASTKQKRGDVQRLSLAPIVIRNRQQYGDRIPMKKELGAARTLQRRLDDTLEGVRQNLGAGKPVDWSATSAIAEAMADSVIRNPDAMLWMVRVQQRSDHAYRHAISSSVWGLVFGRHLGLEKAQLKALATGLLLSQVGKALLPKALLDKEGMLTPAEFTEYKRFVELGVQLIKQDTRLATHVLPVVEYHRERHNGSGFPKGITGDKIPLLAKIAGIVDHYQELTEPASGVSALSALDAVGRLYASRNVEFQDDLVEQFIQAVGIYPTGSLVELNTGEVAVVVAHNPARKLLPKVKVVLDAERNPVPDGRLINLLEFNETCGENERISIAGSLPPGRYTLDAAQVDLTGAQSKWSWRRLVG